MEHRARIFSTLPSDYADKTAFWDYSIDARPLDGLVLEFGVCTGDSINHIARRTKGTVYGFDSFKGNPEPWNTYPKGAFSLESSNINCGYPVHGRIDARYLDPKKNARPRVEDNVELVAGWFEDTLPGFMESHPGNISLLHVDCDLYSSTCTIFRHIENRIVPGTVIIFDELFGYDGWEEHEYKAFQEFVVRSGKSYEYLAMIPREMQASIRITG